MSSRLGVRALHLRLIFADLPVADLRLAFLRRRRLFSLRLVGCLVALGLPYLLLPERTYRFGD